MPLLLVSTCSTAGALPLAGAFLQMRFSLMVLQISAWCIEKHSLGMGSQ